MRTVPRTRVLAILILVVAAVLALLRFGGWFDRPTIAAEPVAVVSGDDTGDGQATTTFDGSMVRRRAAIGVHPAAGADRATITRQMAEMAAGEKIGPLEPATFAVFSPTMLEFLVPEMTFVAPEGVSVESAEAMMRDHQPSDIAFYLVQPVLVHDVTFAVIPAAGVGPAAVAATEDREGILTDVLGKYETSVQRSGVTVRYFGAVLSDVSIASVRAAMGRAAGVPDTQVQVSANSALPGVELDGGVHLVDNEATHHHQ